MSTRKLWVHREGRGVRYLLHCPMARTPELRRIDPHNAYHLHRVDGAFTVAEVLDVERTGFGDALFFEPVNPYEKRYDDEPYDPDEYMRRRDREIFFAFLDEGLAGQLVLRENWNRFAYVEDIVVDRRLRRAGVGGALIHQAETWARETGLAGVVLETQNVNAGACRFYHAMGFRIGGYDRFLYSGIEPGTTEIAVFWYRHVR